MKTFLLFCLATVSGCTCSAPVEPPLGNLISFEAPAPVPLSAAGLPTLPNGHVLVSAAPGLNLEADATRKNPATALGRCATWVMSCFDPASRSLDDCMRSSPTCATQTPWNEQAACCPQPCKDAYARARRGGSEPYPAFDTVLYVERGCMPGLVDYLEGR